MTAQFLPQIKPTFFDQNGNPLASGKVFTYEAGTTTPLATFADGEGTTPNTNPVILDAAGRANIYLSASDSYKFVVKSSADVVQYTVDNVRGSGGACCDCAGDGVT